MKQVMRTEELLVGAADSAVGARASSARPLSASRRLRGCAGLPGSMPRSVPVAGTARFVHHRSMNATPAEAAVSAIAAAIGEPARARMLYCLLDNHARTSTELAIVADISPSTASTHL